MKKGIRALVLGGTGMLGHKVYQEFAGHHETWMTARTLPASPELFESTRVIQLRDAADFSSIKRCMTLTQPSLVVNSVGIIKQNPLIQKPIEAIKVNSLLPHVLAELCGDFGARLIHVSTDCVFSGRSGRYTEEDEPDPVDTYGLTKLLGETDRGLTIRTSIVGRELKGSRGLVEWFLAQGGGPIKGYTQAYFSGLTTLELARLIRQLAEKGLPRSGIYHAAGERISKFRLLQLLRRAFGVDADIQPDDEVRIDRTLDSSQLRKATGWKPPSWEEMIGEMSTDPTPYQLWRSRRDT